MSQDGTLDGLRDAVPGLAIRNEIADRRGKVAEEPHVLPPQPLGIDVGRRYPRPRETVAKDVGVFVDQRRRALAQHAHGSPSIPKRNQFSKQIPAAPPYGPDTRPGMAEYWHYFRHCNSSADINSAVASRRNAR